MTLYLYPIFLHPLSPAPDLNKGSALNPIFHHFLYLFLSLTLSHLASHFLIPRPFFRQRKRNKDGMEEDKGGRWGGCKGEREIGKWEDREEETRIKGCGAIRQI